jgi:hypothetical protein
MKWLPVLLVVLLGCGSMSNVYQASPTLLVVNESIETLVITTLGTRRGTVMPGETRCLEMPRFHILTVTARAVGGGLVVESPTLQMRGDNGWVWRITNSAIASSLDVVPMDPPCGT